MIIHVLLLLGADKKIFICNSLTGETTQKLDSIAGLNDCFFFNDNFLVSASDDGLVRLHDIEQGKCLMSYRIPKGFPYSLSLNPCNNAITVGDTEGFVTSYHLASKDVIQRFPAHASTIVSISYDDEGKELLTGSFDGTARQWIPVQKPLCVRSIICLPKIKTSL
jgi:WD40 repeat protein